MPRRLSMIVVVALILSLMVQHGPPTAQARPARAAPGDQAADFLADTNREVILIPGITFECQPSESDQDATDAVLLRLGTGVYDAIQFWTQLNEELTASGICNDRRRVTPAERTGIFDPVLKGAGIEHLHRKLFSYSPDAGDSDFASYIDSDTRRSLPDMARLLGSQIKRWGVEGKSYTIVGHSLGGAVAAYWAATEEDERVRRSVHSIITLHSPVNGIHFIFRNLLKWSAGDVGADLMLGQNANPTPAILQMRTTPTKIDIFTMGSTQDLLIDKITMQEHSMMGSSIKDGCPDPEQVGSNGSFGTISSNPLLCVFNAFGETFMRINVSHTALLNHSPAHEQIRRIVLGRPRRWSSRWYFTPPDGMFVTGCPGADWHLMVDGMRRAVPDEATFLAWGGVDPQVPGEKNAGVEALAPAQCALILEGPPLDANVVPGPDLNPDLDITIPDADVQTVPDDDPSVTCNGLTVGELIDVDGVIYAYFGGKLHEVPDAKTLEARGWDQLPIRDEEYECIVAVEFGAPVPSVRFPNQQGVSCPVPAVGALWKGSTASVYLYGDGVLRRIPNLETFTAMGYQLSQIVTVPDACIAPQTLGLQLPHVDLPPETPLPPNDPPDTRPPYTAPPGGNAPVTKPTQAEPKPPQQLVAEKHDRPFVVEDGNSINHTRKEGQAGNNRKSDPKPSTQTTRGSTSTGSSSSTGPTAAPQCLTLTLEATANRSLGRGRGPTSFAENAYLFPIGETVTVLVRANRAMPSGARVILGPLGASGPTFDARCDGSTTCRATLTDSGVHAAFVTLKGVQGVSNPPGCGTLSAAGIAVQWINR